MLALVAHSQWLVYKMDVKFIFLNGGLLEEVYEEEPYSFKVPSLEDKVCMLQRALYGLKYALHACI